MEPIISSTANLLIQRLPVDEQRQLLAACEPVAWRLSQVLSEPGAPVQHAYFPISGFLSLVTQVAKHLERKGGSFTANDLVLVFGGNNDMFVAFGTFAAKAAAYTAQATAGQITASKAQELTLAAQIEGDASVKQAGEELAALVRTQIVGKGAKYVAVINALDSTITPFGVPVEPEV